MAGPFSVDELLHAILIELRVQTEIAAEEAGRDNELEDLRADARLAVGGVASTPGNSGTPNDLLVAEG